MALVVAVLDRHAMWCLWQAYIGESQKRPLGFSSKALPFSVGSSFPFERQFLACTWALVKN